MRTTIIEARGTILSMWEEMDGAGVIVLKSPGGEPVDPVQFREAAAAALAEHPGAGMTIDFTGCGRLDATILAVVAQCWLAMSERERELVVIAGDPTDQPVLERLGFDEFFRVTNAA